MGRFLNSGLKKKWIKNYIFTILIICIFIQGFYMVFLKNYYYDWAKENISNRLIAYTSFYNKYLGDNLIMNKGLAKKIVEDFEYKDKLLIEVLDIDGNIIDSSMIMSEDIKIDTEDYLDALNGKLGIYKGRKKTTNEKIIAASSPIYFESQIIGVIRYSTSLKNIDSFLIKKYAQSFGILLFLLSLSFFMSMIFIKTIIKSLKEMSLKAQKIAKGDFDQKIEIKSNDELSQLASTLNYMAAQIKENQKLKNEFISSITHDIKTPLTAIIGWTELLVMQENISKEDLNSQVITIQNETLRLKKLVEELLDFSKFEIDKISLNTDTTNLNALIEESINIFMPRIKKYNIDFSTELDENIDLDIDKNRIKQVFINLIDNSLKYSSNNSKIKIRLKSSDSKIIISIKDNGIGICQEDLRRVKEKFYVVDKSKGGSGLGLSISEKIMQLHNGQLQIKSKFQKGTEVILIFPSKTLA